MTDKEAYELIGNRAKQLIQDIEVQQTEVNENIYKDTDTQNVDDLPEEWKNAEVQNWYVSDNTFYIDVIK